jgi:hypothetical protein
MTVYMKCLGKMTRYKKSVNRITVDKMTGYKMTVVKMMVGSVEKNLCRQNGCRQNAYATINLGKMTLKQNDFKTK